MVFPCTVQTVQCTLLRAPKYQGPKAAWLLFSHFFPVASQSHSSPSPPFPLSSPYCSSASSPPSCSSFPLCCCCCCCCSPSVSSLFCCSSAGGDQMRQATVSNSGDQIIVQLNIWNSVAISWQSMNGERHHRPLAAINQHLSEDTNYISPSIANHLQSPTCTFAKTVRGWARGG